MTLPIVCGIPEWATALQRYFEGAAFVRPPSHKIFRSLIEYYLVTRLHGVIAAEEPSMMPVVRVSAPTWERLKSYARPLEDTPEDVIRLALDALDAAKGQKSVPLVPAKTSPLPKGRKLPQKEFRAPLLEVLNELGGEADVSEIRRALEPRIAPRLSDADYAPVSTGDPRWWNAVCWERNNLSRFRQLDQRISCVIPCSPCLADGGHGWQVSCDGG